MEKRKIGIVLLVVAGILLIPLIAMQFSDEVNWNVYDFALAGVLLLATGLTGLFLSRLINKRKYRIVIYVVLLLILLLVWAELAVGIFGSPFAGT